MFTTKNRVKIHPSGMTWLIFTRHVVPSNEEKGSSRGNNNVGIWKELSRLRTKLIGPVLDATFCLPFFRFQTSLNEFYGSVCKSLAEQPVTFSGIV